jgi:hypothetical protein
MNAHKSQLVHGLQTLTRQFFGYCVSGRIIVLSKDYNCRNEMYHVTVA